MKLLLFLTAVLYSSMYSFQKDSVSIVFKNNSSIPINTINFTIAKRKYSISNLVPSAQSEEIHVNKSYKRFHTTIITDKDTFTYHPIDNMGDSLYTKGTIVIN